MKNKFKLFDHRLKLPRSVFSDSISNDMEPITCANPLAGIESQENLTPEDAARLIGGSVLNYKCHEDIRYDD